MFEVYSVTVDETHWRWKLVIAGVIVAKSTRLYTSRMQCEEELRQVKVALQLP